MKFPQHKNIPFLFMAFSVLILNACNAASTLPSGFQNPVAQTEQGIGVGLKIYNPNQQPQQFTQQSQSPSQNSLKVTLSSPDLSQPLKSPVIIHGMVSGLYFFEGAFPVVLLDVQGHQIARVQAHADSEWMTQNVVPFTAELTFTAPSRKNAKLVFMKDNPSGSPQNNFSQSFEVTLQ